MSKLPSMPLYVDDFEAATSHLTLEEDGAYNRLLRLCWRSPRCSIPDDPAWVARRLRVDMATYERVIAPLLEEFFTLNDGQYYHEQYVNIWSPAKERQTGPSRESIPQIVREFIRARDGNRCRYCASDCGPFEIDHVMPWSRGGRNEEINLVLSCRTCNRSKGNKTLRELGWVLQ